MSQERLYAQLECEWQDMILRENAILVAPLPHEAVIQPTFWYYCDKLSEAERARPGQRPRTWKVFTSIPHGEGSQAKARPLFPDEQSPIPLIRIDPRSVMYWDLRWAGWQTYGYTLREFGGQA